MEKKGCRKVYNEMLSFSDWINSHSLLDLQLCGASYTWSNHQDPPIMSRLDRFLIANDWLDLYPDVNQVALPKPASDHCPIMLDSECERWGPAPFRFELMWLQEKSFPELISDWWKKMAVEGWAGHKFAAKLKLLKAKIKEWVKENFGEVGMMKANILNELQSLDAKEERDGLSREERRRRFKLKEDFQRKVK